MIPRWFVWFCVILGSSIGGYIPAFFGAQTFSFYGILGSMIGGILGIWAALKIGNLM